VTAPPPEDLLDRYSRAARTIYRFRYLLYVGIAAGCGFFVYGIAIPGTESSESRMLLPLVGVLWCVCLTFFAHGFDRSFPKVDPDSGWFARLKTSMVRGIWHLVALGVVSFGAATLLLTARAAMMAIK
jgi:hypothetical protein